MSFFSEFGFKELAVDTEGEASLDGVLELLPAVDKEGEVGLDEVL